MPQPRKEDTVPVRIRISSRTKAKQMVKEYELSGMADAIDAALDAWVKLNDDAKMDILGRERKEFKAKPKWWKGLKDEDIFG